MAAEPQTIGTLARLIGGEVRGDATSEVTDITHDSRAAGPGQMYAAVRGFTSDGHLYAPVAASQGAALLVEEWIDVDAPQIKVPDTRQAMARIAAAVHGHPADHIRVVGVTGTNGKTTVTYLLESIVAAAGLVPGRIGTLGAAIAGRPVPVPRTTPESTDLQRLLAEMVAGGVDIAAIEVSSHALELHRVDGVDFAVGAFTNFSQDHLDFHKTMDEYFAAKARLFDGRAATAVIWTDDPKGAEMATMAVGPVVTVGLGEGTDVRGMDPRPGLVSSSVLIDFGDARLDAYIGLGGDFNIANGLVAAAIAYTLGIDTEAIGEGLAQVRPVPGRLEPVDAGQPFVVLVDYAHSPGGVEAAVAAVRGVSSGTILAVVGSAGDRDAAKRPLMGAAATRADIAILTSDNPRSEDPEAILAEVVAGTVGTMTTVYAEVDREAAIGKALDLAAPGDVVLILGKGHEQGQEFATHTIPFDDREVAARLLARRYGTGEPPA
jgi:UDP-N-acetylmuramoyl-L-alanyl-D-glutamate--2,6-diaminopimelate ligase